MKPYAGLLGAVTLAALLTGCVDRRYVVTSDPPGALVLRNGQPIGATPADGHFVYSGHYPFTLLRDGYQTLAADMRKGRGQGRSSTGTLARGTMRGSRQERGLQRNYSSGMTRLPARAGNQPMRVLPVLDLLGGQVVRGVGGQRHQYRPVVSRL